MSTNESSKALDKTDLTSLVIDARDGSRAALEALLKNIQPLVFKIAQRFLACPANTEDAVQEILLKIVTRLSQFDGKSQFTTWVYRIASNQLLDIKRRENPKYAPVHTMSFDEFSQDLATDMSDHQDQAYDERLLAEVRVGCTLALLQCLGPELRMAYILGDILELDHQEASDVLEISTDNYRKRLSRARSMLNDFMLTNCGLVNASNNCRCNKRLPKAIEIGRVNTENLIFSSSQQSASAFPQVLDSIRHLEETQRVAALYRAQEEQPTTDTFIKWLQSALSQNEGLIQ